MNLYNLSSHEQEEFMSYKELQYKERRERVRSVCEQLEKQNPEDWKKLTSVSYTWMKYNSREKIAYCQIPKVSTTLMILSN